MSTPFAATTRLLAPARTARGPQSVAEVLRRKELARRQVARKNEKRRQKTQSDRERDYRSEVNAQTKVSFDQIKEARRRHKEDYELGPLAPRRDVGTKENTFGTVDPAQIQDVKVPKGQKKWCPFALGDRVVLLEGKDKGKIGSVSDIDRDTQRIDVTDLNEVYLTTLLPSHSR